MRDVKQFEFLVSCPSDVTKEPEIVRRVFDRFNSTVGKAHGVRINPVHWRNDAYPESGGNPQSLLNKQIVDKSDALIAVFWTRFGTSTEEYGSGTEEEIERTLRSGKPVFLYFSDVPFPPSRIDATEHEKVKAFRKRYESRGIYGTYATHEEFEQRLFDHLAAHFIAKLVRPELPPNKTEVPQTVATKEETAGRIRTFIQELDQIITTADLQNDCQQASIRLEKCEKRLFDFLLAAGFPEDARIVHNISQALEATFGAPRIHSIEGNVKLCTARLTVLVEEVTARQPQASGTHGTTPSASIHSPTPEPTIDALSEAVKRKGAAGKTIFISHSSADKAIADAFVDLLVLGVGVNQEDIFCTSVEGQGIPTGEKFADYIRGKLSESKVAFALLSPRFCQSQFCLCELGALWSLFTHVYPVLIPPTQRSDIKAPIDDRQMVTINDPTGLDDLRDDLRTKVTHGNVKTSRWQEKKAQFLQNGTLWHISEAPEHPEPELGNPPGTLNAVHRTLEKRLAQHEQEGGHRADRQRRLEDTVTRRHIYPSCDWQELSASLLLNRPLKHLAICVLVMPEFIDDEPIFAEEIEQDMMLRTLGAYNGTRRLGNGTVAFGSPTDERRRQQWDWWKADRFTIVYRDGVFEFIWQPENPIETISSWDLSVMIKDHCSKIGGLLKDRLRPGVQTHIEVHILGSRGRCFFNDETRERSCECDHGVICLEYDVDLTDSSALENLPTQAVKDVMSECGGVSAGR